MSLNKEVPKSFLDTLKKGTLMVANQKLSKG